MARYGISQAELKRLVHYDPEAGVMTRLVVKGKAKAGEPIGSVGNHGYLAASIGGKPQLLHRMAWLYAYGELPDCIDHVNHDRTDNRLSNLRSVSRPENQRNQKMKANNTSGFTGVYWSKEKHKWLAKIKINYKQKHIGYYSDIESAIQARKKAESRYGFHENHGRAA